jgi:hypothetical protein
MTRPAFEPGPPRWEARRLTAWAMARPLIIIRNHWKTTTLQTAVFRWRPLFERKCVLNCANSSVKQWVTIAAPADVRRLVMRQIFYFQETSSSGVPCRARVGSCTACSVTKVTAANCYIKTLSLSPQATPVFWVMTMCSPLKFNRHFWGAYYLHRQVRGRIWARHQREAGNKQSNWLPEVSGCIGNRREMTRQQVISRWLAHRTEQSANTHWVSHTTGRTNRRHEQDNHHGP